MFFFKLFNACLKTLLISFLIKKKFSFCNFCFYSFFRFNYLNISFFSTFFGANYAGTPYKKFYLFYGEEVYFKLEYILKSENFCCELSDLMFWFVGGFDVFFFNFFFFFKFFFKKKN